MKFREETTNRAGESLAPRTPVPARRSFWIFLTIFSVTIFGLSTQMASGYWRYCERTRRVSLPLGYNHLSPHLAEADAEDHEARDADIAQASQAASQ